MAPAARGRLAELSSEPPLWLPRPVRWAEAADALATVDGLVTSLRVTIDGEVLDRMPNLRHVAVYGSTLADVDEEALRARGITWSNVLEYCDPETAEFIVAMMLAHVRGVDRGLQDPPRALAGQCVGLVGYGGVAKEVAGRLRALGVRVVYTRRTPGPQDTTAQGYRTLDALLGEAHIVSLHVPVGIPTLGAAELDRLRPGAILVNVCAGHTVDPLALRNWLDQGRGVLLMDVVGGEAYPELASHPAVVVAPNPAYRTVDSLARRDEILFAGLKRALERPGRD